MGVNTLTQAGAPVPSEQAIPAPATNSIVAVTDKKGNPLTVIVKTKKGSVKATVRGIDIATGKLILSCEDDPAGKNRAAFPSSAQPATDRRNEASTAEAVQALRDSENLLTITVANKDLANKIKNGQIAVVNGAVQLTQKEAQAAINGNKRTLLHIVDKTKKNDEINTIKQPEKEETPWYKNWKVWAIILLTVGLATIGILGFRKGGWWNKNKKKTQSTVQTPSTTTSQYTPPSTQPTNTDERPASSHAPEPSQSSGPSIPGGNITSDYEITGPTVTHPANQL